MVKLIKGKAENKGWVFSEKHLSPRLWRHVLTGSVVSWQHKATSEEMI